MKMPFASAAGTESQAQFHVSDRKRRLWITSAIVMTVLLWGLAVALPVWDTRSNQSGEWAEARGYFPAILGWLGILAMCPAWFANLILIPSCITLYKGLKGGFVLSLIAFAVAASAYLLPGLYGDNDEAVIEGRLIGFYLWLGAFLTMALAHAVLGVGAERKATGARVAVVLLMVLGIAGLERRYRVGVSPLETALKNPNDITAITSVLARHPPQSDKDAALCWAVRQNLWAARPAPSKHIVMLLAAGADPNYRPDKTSSTLLMAAVSRRGSEALVELLVKSGADVNARDYRGKTVLDMAKEAWSSPECQKILTNAGARSSSQPNG